MCLERVYYQKGTRSKGYMFNVVHVQQSKNGGEESYAKWKWD